MRPAHTKETHTMEEQLITPTLLAAAGITIADDELVDFLTRVNTELDERVGTEIAETLDDDQLKTLIELQQKGNEDEVDAWIQANVVELEQIVEDERDILLGELAANADQFNKSTGESSGEQA